MVTAKTTLHPQQPIKSNQAYTYREGTMATCPAHRYLIVYEEPPHHLVSGASILIICYPFVTQKILAANMLSGFRHKTLFK